MKSVIAIAFLVGAAFCGKPYEPYTGVTGTTPPPAPDGCGNGRCNNRADGNYEYAGDSHYFLQCSGGNAYCQACWPLSLVYVPRCDQCLYSSTDDCVTTKSWEPATTFSCPDLCPGHGPAFRGNCKDPANPKHYVGCWDGITVGCVACPAGLLYNEHDNACLYDGLYMTQPSK